MFLSAIERTIFKLMWTKMERVKRSTLTLPLEEGGLGVLQIAAKIKAFRVKHNINVFRRPRAQWVPFAIYCLNIPFKWIGNETDGTKYRAHTTHRGLSPSRVPAALKELKLLGQEGDPLQSHCTQTH
jgi:hypothetical protein